MKKSLPTLAAIALMAIPSHAAVLYSNDFDGNVVVDSGVGVTAFANGGLETANAGAWNANGWSGSYFANRSTGNPALASSLTLTNLAPHTTVSISFLLGFLESWDSSDGGCCSPDLLDISIDGVPVLVALTANNALGSVENYGGGTELFDVAQVNGNFGFSDALVDMSTAGLLTFAHTANTLTLSIQAYGNGWQGGGDEAWGVDSLAITYDGVRGPDTGVPAPGAAALLLGAGLFAAGIKRRRA